MTAVVAGAIGFAVGIMAGAAAAMHVLASRRALTVRAPEDDQEGGRQ